MSVPSTGKWCGVPERYWLREPNDSDYREVTCAEYVAAERQAGFHNTMGKPDEPATASFTTPAGVRGTTLQRQGEPFHVNAANAYGFNPHHHFYDRDGNPVTVEKWARLRSPEYRTVQESALTTDSTLITVYLGFVDPMISEARLFGTAIITREPDEEPAPGSTTIVQIDLHDTEAEAIARHAAHLQARADGYHCARCKDGQDHQD